MSTIKIIIERSTDLFGAYAENVEGVHGLGETVEEAKKEALASIELIKKYNSEDNIPEILKGDFNIIYQFDTESLLKYYNGIFTNAALERLTGINQRQLQHYASGLKKPREAQAKKITEGLNKLGRELMSLT